MFGIIFDEEYLKSTIKHLNDVSEADIENIVKTDYIAGIPGILRLMQQMKIISHMSSIHKKVFDLFIKVLKKRIFEQEDQIASQVGLAHGLSGFALALSSEYKKEHVLIHELLTKEMTLTIKEENSYKWCWGLAGMIQARIEIVKENSSAVITSQLLELIEKYGNLLDKIPQDDTLCHGTGSVLTTLNSIFEYSGDQRWKEKMSVLLSNVKCNSITNGYQILRLLDLEMKGLFDGISSVGFSYFHALGDVLNLILLNIE